MFLIIKNNSSFDDESSLPRINTKWLCKTTYIFIFNSTLSSVSKASKSFIFFNVRFCHFGLIFFFSKSSI